MTAHTHRAGSRIPRLCRYAAAVILVLCGCSGTGQNPEDSAAIRGAVARHLATSQVPTRLGGEVRPLCLGIGTLAADSPMADPDPAVLRDLRDAGVAVQPVSTCVLPFEAPRVTDRSTGDRRVLLLVSPSHTATDGGASVVAIYYYAGTAGAVWRCDVAHRDGEWRVARCEVTSES